MAVIVETGRTPADILEVPNLVELQRSSYDWFLREGLDELFHSFSPIEDYTGNLSLEFLSYTVGDPIHTLEQCREHDSTFEVPLKAKVRLVNKETGEIQESEVYMGELPMMTSRGTFLINGAERVVISQLARSPGVYFRDVIDTSGRVLYSAQIIPQEGAWVEVDTDANQVISVRIGQARKLPITSLLRALDYYQEGQKSDVPRTGTTEEILARFGRRTRLRQPKAEDLVGKWTVNAFTTASNEALIGPCAHIHEAAAEGIAALGRAAVDVIEVPPHVSATLEADPTHSAEEGLLDVYRKMRPGDPPTLDSAEVLVRSLLFDVKRYDLARVGRYKVNKKLGSGVPTAQRTLCKLDFMAIVDYLVALSHGEGQTDDIDHLQNKRIRAVGELLQGQLRVGFLRMERVARERMTSLEPDKIVPQSIISIKPISAAIKSFFGSGQLSQFMDQINPLAELAHKRRLSALGPGGLI